MLKSVILAPDESFEDKSGKKSHNSLILESDPNFQPPRQLDTDPSSDVQKKPKPTKNGFRDIYFWSKSELNELLSIQAAISHLHRLEQKIESFATKNKISSKDIDLADDHISQNSSAMKEMMQHDQEHIESMKPQDIDKFNESINQISPSVQLKNVITEVLGGYTIPFYKKNRASQYK